MNIKHVIIISVILTVSGLNAQSFGSKFSDKSRPSSSPEVTMPGQGSYRENNIRMYTLPVDAAIDPKTYIVGPGDLFGVNILSLENVNVQVPVSPTGDVLVPYVGICRVNGLTLEKAIAKIKTVISEKIKSAEINITLMDIRTYKIMLAGAVKTPGFYEVTPVTKLSDVIEEAEGFHQLAREFAIEIRKHDGKMTVVNFLEFLLDGNMDANPTFLEGDQIYVPFGSLEKEGVVIRGSIAGSGYDIITPGESLQHFFLRQTAFSRNADLQNVKITRLGNSATEIMTVYPADFPNIVLKAGDAIDILSERGVSVNGFVRTPGSFTFFPGYTALDYVNMAGGNTTEGDATMLVVRHLDGSIETGEKVVIQRGDVIFVPRTTKSIWFGDVAILEIVASVATLVMTFIAAMK